LQLLSSQPGSYAITLSQKQKHQLDIKSVPFPQAVEGPWTLEFPHGWGAPEKTTLARLISWSDASDDGIRYFSGTATYRTTFQAAKVGANCKLFIDLGKVEVIAEVWINGKSVGTLWKPPFTLEITDLLRAETNDLVVHVTNLWPNRLIGDEQFRDDCTEDGRWVSGVIPSIPEWLKKGQPRPDSRRLTFCTWKHWNRNDVLLPSGLLGPVTLRQVVVNSMRL
jgi:hypothetical protein